MLFWGCNLLLALGAIPPAALAYTFVNPAIHGGQTSFAHNTVYEEKSVLEVQWTQGETDEDATVALWQVNQSTSLSAPETIGDLEYIAGEFQAIMLHMLTYVEIHTDAYL